MKLFVLREEKNAQCLWDYLKGWREAAKAGKPLVVEVYPESAKRSTRQNAAYWAMLHQLAESAWIEGRQHKAETWHHYCAGRFLGYVDGIGGAMVPISTTTLGTTEFSDYMQQIQVFAAFELGIGLDWIEV